MAASASRRTGSASRRISWPASAYIFSRAFGISAAAFRMAAGLTSRSRSVPISITGRSTLASFSGVKAPAER